MLASLSSSVYHNSIMMYFIRQHLSIGKTMKASFRFTMALCFGISTKTLLVNERVKYTGSILWVQHYQALKLQCSIRSKRDLKENEPKARVQSNRDLNKSSLRLRVVLSNHSKLLAFHSHQIHQIKQWGTTFQMAMLWWWSNQPCQ